MLARILIGLAVVFVGLIVFIATRPADFRVTRSATIAAPAETVFAQVNDLHHWEAWSPWAKMDPDAKSTYEGPAAGTGAAMAWSGNNAVGAGKMTITDSRANEAVRFRLDFERPMKGTSDAEFTFKPQGDQTVVTWTMSGKNNFVAKAVGLFMNCDQMVGGQFEQGLANLNSVVQAAAAKK